jgi:hypothetical protein
MKTGDIPVFGGAFEKARGGFTVAVQETGIALFQPAAFKVSSVEGRNGSVADYFFLFTRHERFTNHLNRKLSERSHNMKQPKKLPEGDAHRFPASRRDAQIPDPVQLSADAPRVR